MKALIEVCVGDADSLDAAVRARAARIELCAALEAGGVTPSESAVRAAVEADGPKVNVLVRPRGGDFVYSPAEVSQIAEDIRMCRRAGAHGVVIGALHPDGSIDLESLRRWHDAADGLSITFHRAFDMCADPLAALDLLRPYADRILTSGLAASAWEGRDMLRTLVAAGSGLTILAGGGINADNVAALVDYAGLSEVHGTFAATRPGAMTFRREGVSMSAPGADEFSRRSTSFENLSRAIQSLA